MNLSLRDVEPADLEIFFEHQRDPVAVERANFPARDYEKFIDHWTRNILGNETGRAQTVTVDGQPAGNFVAWWHEGRRQIGYWFGRAFWGRGIGTQALAQFLEQEKARPLYAEVYVGNTASIKLLERCGFRNVETIRDGDAEYAVLTLD